ncbi:glycosyltransferase family 59 protein [Phycomyces blakesleeanus NRRL 1555(-)]|uniref:Dol-P-Glc:Glc(2)Man(9)GlcNAc(2)-PP-Dol alpha-1,2-glucosyltransferase n=1 Tax=Phycomyces blakesleeanus (strain ATCC 8743b / DSM 1359 / FGSC 10004 / NBRC 33097 / NRRL 1555) TaxID=763407 RepID=A0A162PM42_PHYB8|nr:glycosyltransferase family 59 protein [Phycomyces blakesleeanus NRRL 1555(-)]OAD74167.1 glycosyltransferase family 59 protein [Phycomyces blakesleeanus NRRL 1555(-)]|eukprot:XP_018292207.1 glycosyltransferase family 59 protein [Phycomyces blakesleeanus NRRL 1555(-)]
MNGRPLFFFFLLPCLMDVFALALHSVALAWESSKVRNYVSKPYMDEIFHVPQAQRYCMGDYASWDPKLTTPPGLYIISRGFSILSTAVGVDGCTPSALRMTNIFFSLGLLFVIDSLIGCLHPTSPAIRSRYALALVWFPVLFFFNGLYYTDTGSTFFVLLSYLLVNKRHYWAAGTAGIVSVTFRQTNIIWVLFFMVLVIIQTLEDASKKSKETTAVYNPTFSNVTQFALTGFAGFLVWNGGIVLGDRSNHLAGYNVPQLFYFSSFLSFFMAPWILNIKNISEVLMTLTKPKQYEHPFLLSDNRHYTFYIWKNIYRRHWSVRYILTPFYLLSVKLNIAAIVPYVSVLHVIGYVFTLVLTLVPSPLLEFRYFIVPFLFYAVHFQPQLKRTYLAIAFYSIINLATLYMFFNRTFEWASEPGSSQSGSIL